MNATDTLTRSEKKSRLEILNMQRSAILKYFKCKHDVDKVNLYPFLREKGPPDENWRTTYHVL